MDPGLSCCCSHAACVDEHVCVCIYLCVCVCLCVYRGCGGAVCFLGLGTGKINPCHWSARLNARACFRESPGYVLMCPCHSLVLFFFSPAFLTALTHPEMIKKHKRERKNCKRRDISKERARETKGKREIYCAA